MISRRASMRTSRRSTLACACSAFSALLRALIVHFRSRMDRAVSRSSASPVAVSSGSMPAISSACSIWSWLASMRSSTWRTSSDSCGPSVLPVANCCSER
jgi:hypothetical protein